MRSVPDKHTESHSTLLTSTAFVHRSQLNVSMNTELSQMASILLNSLSREWTL
jgi:hypothetical protein